VFNAPQPPGQEVLKSFPAEYQGTYLAPETSEDTMVIAKTTATFIEFVEETIHITDLSDYPTISFSDGLLYDSSKPDIGGIPYRETDSTISYSYFSRSMIGLSDSLVVKQGKGYLVANARFESDGSDYWDVFLLDLNSANDLLVSGIGDLKTPDDTDDSQNYDGKISDFTPIVPFEQINDDTYLVSPSQQQFVKLVKKGLFSSEAVYRRVY
jgi:hypothetical protein